MTDTTKNSFEIVSISTEYGMLHTQSCDKYLLMPDDEADRYFLNHRTGELHINSLEEPLDANSYCIEYRKDFYDQTIQVKYICPCAHGHSNPKRRCFFQKQIEISDLSPKKSHQILTWHHESIKFFSRPPMSSAQANESAQHTLDHQIVAFVCLGSTFSIPNSVYFHSRSMHLLVFPKYHKNIYSLALE